jgi:cyclophilin family peptidyl-prolyl cis-trans isomerase
MTWPRIIPTAFACAAAITAIGCGGAPQSPVPVVMETSRGIIRMELYPQDAPRTVANFLAYADSGFYSGTIFHRVIPRFMIQGGGYTERLREKRARPPVKSEAGNGLPNERGTIAMARMADPNSATSQFFINLIHNRSLDGSYTVFGKVTEGMDVVDAISALETRRDGEESANLPVETVVIKSVRRE